MNTRKDALQHVERKTSGIVSTGDRLWDMDETAVCADKSSLSWLTNDDFFPHDALVLTSANGSMEISLTSLIMEDINKYVRKFVPHNQKLCITLDGHSSRNRAKNLRKSENMNCGIVQTFSDTSHFLQPKT